MRKKIVFLDHSLDGGGAERVLCTIMRTLDAGEIDGHLIIVNRLGALKDLVPHNIQVHELGVSRTSCALLAAIQKLSEIKPEIVFSTLTRTTVLSIFCRFFLHKYKIIARYPNMPSAEMRCGYLKGWRLFLTKLVYRRVNLTIAQTEEMAGELLNSYKIPFSNIITLNNPIDTAYIEERLINQESPFDETTINIVASGRLIHQKGFDVLINAFNIAFKSNSLLRLHILGNDINNTKTYLDSLISLHNLTNYVYFHGFIENPYPYYKYCSFFILSSRWEGYPNVLLECLYLRKTVIATRCVPIVEKLVKDGKNGFLVDNEDFNGMAKCILLATHFKPEISQIVNTSANFRYLFMDSDTI